MQDIVQEIEQAIEQDTDRAPEDAPQEAAGIGGVDGPAADAGEPVWVVHLGRPSPGRLILVSLARAEEMERDGTGRPASSRDRAIAGL